jgi:hypothetical protein
MFCWIVMASQRSSSFIANKRCRDYAITFVILQIAGFGFAIFFVTGSCVNYTDANDRLLPIEWMSLEAIVDHRYSDKSEV